MEQQSVDSAGILESPRDPRIDREERDGCRSQCEANGRVGTTEIRRVIAGTGCILTHRPARQERTRYRQDNNESPHEHRG
jgi:hypothetical protein